MGQQQRIQRNCSAADCDYPFIMIDRVGSTELCDDVGP